MGEGTAITWTDNTFNPWEGCARVSPGCLHCYAETRDERFHDGNHWGKNATRKMMSDSYWKQPLKWNRRAEKRGVRERVFCASLADVFEDRPDLIEPRRRLFRLIDATPHLDWLLLTKRPENFAELLPWMVEEFWGDEPGAGGETGYGDEWPNVWLGASVEDQERADERVPLLVNTPAEVRFISAEPLLGPVDLTPWLADINWVIVGGESGPDTRPMSPQWARSLREQCAVNATVFHFKQWGSWAPAALPQGAEISLLRDGEQIPYDRECHGAVRNAMDYWRSGRDGGYLMTYMGVSSHAGGRELDDVFHDDFPRTR